MDAPAFIGPSPVELPAASRKQQETQTRKTAWRIASEKESVQPSRMSERDLVKYLEEGGNQSTVKSEFETTAAFEQRRRKHVVPRSFVIDLGFLSNNFNYDADTQTMAVDFDEIARKNSASLSAAFSAPDALRDSRVIWLQHTDGNESEYTGQNGFGAKRVIKKWKGTSRGVLPAHAWPARGELKTLIKMPPAEAQKLKYSGHFRVLGTLLAETPVVRWTHKKEATYSDPNATEIAYFVTEAQIDRIEVISSDGKTLAAVERVR